MYRYNCVSYNIRKQLFEIKVRFSFKVIIVEHRFENKGKTARLNTKQGKLKGLEKTNNTNKFLARSKTLRLINKLP